MKWNEITIRQAQELSRIETSMAGTDFDIKLAKIAYLEGMTMEQMDALTVGDLDKLMKKYAPLFNDVLGEKMMGSWKHKGVKYQIISDIRDINGGQYNELIHFSQGKDIVSKLHYVMATLVQPYERKWFVWRKVKKDHAKVSEVMLDAPFHLCLRSAVFFCKLYMSLLVSMKGYFLQQLKEMGRTPEQAEKEYMALLSISDGFIMQRA